LFAAAISTLAGSISSLSSSTVFDLFGSVKNRFFEKNKLLISRWTTLFWSLLLIASALFFMSSPQTVVELALSIASFTYGGLLGTFLLGVFNKKAKQEDAIAAFTAGIFVMLAVVFLQLVAWTWFILIGAGTTLLVGTILSRLPNEKQKGTSP
jgi:Na+(H+)/acetate symporter ActP